MSVRRFTSVALACAAIGLAAPLPPAAADAAGSPCRDTGRSLRYVVLFDRPTSEADAAAEIRAACGELTTYYARIGVAVATSADPRFGPRLGPDRAFSAQARRLAAARLSTSGHPADPPEAAGGTTSVPGADRTGEQWGMRAIGADRARQVQTGSRDVVVGVLDSGIDPAHPELRDAVDPALSAGCLTGAPDPAPSAWRPGTSAHGTHVAGTIAAADDGKGTTGVAPGARLASVRVVGESGYVDPEAAVCGFMWAAEHRMTVTNSSFFVGPWSLSCAPGSEHRVVREAIARAVEYAGDAGTLNVAAATNEAVNLTKSPRSGAPERAGSGCEALPAGLRGVLTVSAVNADGVKASYSSYGLGVVDVTAPGGDEGDCVLSTVPGGYEPLCGTSMAAPHVAGVAALLASAHPGYPAQALARELGEQATPKACPTDYDPTGDGRQDAFCAGYQGYNGFYGNGMVDALAAVR